MVNRRFAPPFQHPPHIFCTIVAFGRRGGGSRHAPIGDFFEFPFMDASTYVSNAEIHTWRSDAEVDMAMDHHLGGRRGHRGTSWRRHGVEAGASVLITSHNLSRESRKRQKQTLKKNEGTS